MKEFEFENTSLSGQYSLNLRDRGGIIWVEARTPEFFRILFSSIVDYLKFNQSKDLNRLGFKMKDDRGNFKFGAVLNFNKPEEGSEEDSGNWYLEFTFYEEDMTDLDKEIDNLSDAFAKTCEQNANVISYGRFRSRDLMHTMLNTAIDTLTQFLDDNAIEGEEVVIRLRGIFEATVEIEDGKKIMSITPGEYIKQLIKNDSVL